jgi:hypothetical protein
MVPAWAKALGLHKSHRSGQRPTLLELNSFYLQLFPYSWIYSPTRISKWLFLHSATQCTWFRLKSLHSHRSAQRATQKVLHLIHRLFYYTCFLHRSGLGYKAGPTHKKDLHQRAMPAGIMIANYCPLVSTYLYLHRSALICIVPAKGLHKRLYYF